MQRFDQDHVRMVVAAPPQAVWDVIGDITRMPGRPPFR